MYKRITPPLQLGVNPGVVVQSAAHCSNVADLIAYLQTLPGDLDVFSVNPEGNELGVSVRGCFNTRSLTSFILIDDLLDEEHKQMYPEAWEDQ